MDSNYKLYHLVRPSEHGSSDQQDKMVTEIYLTRQVLSSHSLCRFRYCSGFGRSCRLFAVLLSLKKFLEYFRLLTMKGTLQKFIQNLLEVIFSAAVSNSAIPCVKYMFDFMDDQVNEISG